MMECQIAFIAGYPFFPRLGSHISHWIFLRNTTYLSCNSETLSMGVLFLCVPVELHDVFESETHIFLVFELLRQGELFDYLTTVVTLSEKKTK